MRFVIEGKEDGEQVFRFRLNNDDKDMNFEVCVNGEWERICFVAHDEGRPTFHVQGQLPKGFVKG